MNGPCVYVTGLLSILSLFVVYCEYYHYYTTISDCYWRELFGPFGAKEILHVMVVADTHLLGKRNGHWFDKLRREWQMYRSFQTSIELHSPHVVVFLGDLFDEAKWCSDEEFDAYLKRFEELFYLPENTSLIVTPGNHDIGFHDRTHPHLSSRFEKAFGVPAVHLQTINEINFVTVNSIAMEGDDCNLCKTARMQLNAIIKELSCHKKWTGTCQYETNVDDRMRPILLQHYPLYRESDAECDEIDDAPAEIKDAPFRPKWDCLSKEASRKLIDKLQPRIVLSGHTHHGCETRHNMTYNFSSSPTPTFTFYSSTREYNVASFSWGNKVNPAYIMLTVSPEEVYVSKCHLPREDFIQIMYIFALLFMFAWTLWYLVIRYEQQQRTVKKILPDTSRDLAA